MILSAQATYLAKSLDLEGVKDLYKQRVKMLVVVDSDEPQDVPAMRKVMAEFPSPIVLCGKEIGEALPFPGASIEKDFGWAPAHPVVDAYHAFRDGVYDFPSYDLVAALYAVHPDKGFFKLSDAAGKVRSLIFDPSQKDAIIQAFVSTASAKPVAPQQRFRPPAAADGKAAPPVKTPDK